MMHTLSCSHRPCPFPPTCSDSCSHSCSQALIRLHFDGCFYLRNVGRRVLHVNSTAVGHGQLAILGASCLLQVRNSGGEVGGNREEEGGVKGETDAHECGTGVGDGQLAVLGASCLLQVRERRGNWAGDREELLLEVKKWNRKTS